MSGFMIIICEEKNTSEGKKNQNTYTAIFCCTEFPLYPLDKMCLVKML